MTAAFKVSMTVERNIDGSWFSGNIVSIDPDGDFLTIKYFDDDNIEDMVPVTEVRIVSSDVPIDSSPKLGRKNPLPKPLVGLMDDDENERRAHRPIAVIHSNDDGESGIFYETCPSYLTFVQLL